MVEDRPDLERVLAADPRSVDGQLRLYAVLRGLPGHHRPGA